MIDGYNPEFRDSGFRKLVKTVNLDDFRKICYVGCDLILIEIENNKSLFTAVDVFVGPDNTICVARDLMADNYYLLFL